MCKKNRQLFPIAENRVSSRIVAFKRRIGSVLVLCGRSPNHPGKDMRPHISPQAENRENRVSSRGRIARENRVSSRIVAFKGE